MNRLYIYLLNVTAFFIVMIAYTMVCIIIHQKLFKSDKKMKCIKYKTCKHYRKDSFTCNSDLEAINFCGIRKEDKR